MEQETSFLESGYEIVGKDYWTGRTDSEDNYDAFRWHQWIESIDLRTAKKNQFSHKFGVAFIGFCSDIGVSRNKGRIGTAKGPDSIRKELMNRPCAFSNEVKLYDAGNLIPTDGSLEKIQKDLSDAVNKILELGLFPIVLGGGHAVALGNFYGTHKYLCEKEKKESLGIVNFDAHFDIRPYLKEGTSGTMFRQIADYCSENNYSYNYFCLGIQKSGNTVDLFKTAHRLGVEYLLAKDIELADIWSITEKLDGFIKRNDALYLTICADVFSSAHAPGVSAPQPLGLYPEKVLKLIKYILKSKKVLSFDIAEVSPRFDMDNTTASLAAIIIFTVVKTLAEENGFEASYE
ncbi:MAG: formimidoylglutamase [Proteocatella sp.]